MILLKANAIHIYSYGCSAVSSAVELYSTYSVVNSAFLWFIKELHWYDCELKLKKLQVLHLKVLTCFNIKQRYQNINACIIFETIRSTVVKHVSVKILPVLNGAVTRTVWRARASRRTGGKLIMWKMRAWKASVGVGMGADEGCPPCAHRSWPDWEQDQRCDSSILSASLPPFPATFP